MSNFSLSRVSLLVLLIGIASSVSGVVPSAHAAVITTVVNTAASVSGTGDALSAENDATNTTISSSTGPLGDVQYKSMGSATNGASPVSANANVASSGSLILTQSDAAPASSLTTAALDDTAVATDADLDTYAKATLANDPQVIRINSSPQTVSLSYTEQGHLFGVIPMTVTATGSVNADGSVSVNYPWYQFLLSTNKEGIQASLQNRVQADMTAMAAANPQANGFTPPEQAQILADIRIVLKSEYDTTVGTTAAANTSVSSSSSASTTTGANSPSGY